MTGPVIRGRRVRLRPRRDMGALICSAWVLCRLARVLVVIFAFLVGRNARGKGSAPVTRDQGSLRQDSWGGHFSPQFFLPVVNEFLLLISSPRPRQTRG